MKTIKIIDLLNLVYEKKAPRKILYKYCEYEFNSVSNDYENEDGLELFSYLFQNEEHALSFEVEIIEEKPKKIEYIKKNQNRNDKINEIIDLVNYLLEKSDSNE